MSPNIPPRTAAAPALVDQNLFRQACYIDGAWVGFTSGRAIAVDNPATGETIGTVPRLGRPETARPSTQRARALRRGEPRPRRSAPSCCGAGSS